MNDQAQPVPEEGPLLSAVQLPGVVRILPRKGDRDAGAPAPDLEGLKPLTAMPPRSARDVCLLMALLSRTVAEVHRSGVVHRSLGPSAVLVDPHDRPVLRGFTHARHSTDPADQAIDVTALRSLATGLLTELGRAPDGDEVRGRRRVSRVIRKAGDGSALDLSEHLVRTLRALGHGGHAPGRRPEPGPLHEGATGSGAAAADRVLRARVRARSTGPDRRALVGLASGLAVVVVLAAAALAGWPRSDSVADGPTVLPTTVVGSPEVIHHGSVYRVGRPGDVAVLRTCDGQASVWLLRPSTGGLYRFDELADAGPVSTAPLRYAPGATGLSVHRVLDCDHVHLELPGDTHVEVAG